MSTGSVPEFSSPGRRFRAARQRTPWGTILVVGSVVMLVAVLAAYFAIRGFPVLEPPGGHESVTAPAVHESQEFNYRFVLPDAPWKQDNQIRLKVKANLLAMRRTNPDAWFALAARDFKTRTPEKDEATKEAIKRLEGGFQELEWDPAPNSSLAGRPAWVVKFQGKVDNTLMKGECYILVHKTMIYWFLTWSAAKDARRLVSEWNRIREGFSLVDVREN